MRFVANALSALLALTLVACSTATYESNAVAGGSAATIGGDRLAGSRVFDANCSTCHGSNGEGGVVGPSLRHESFRLDYGALVSWIEDPQAPMPKLYPKFLTTAQVRDVAAYVESL
jgi:ubiquinol-cytochrome c reductase cytochrome c subunit